MAGWTHKQILIGITVVLAMIDCAGWAVSTLLIWWFRTAGFFEPLTPEQLSVNTQFAVVVSALLVLNIAGALAFILARGGYGPVLAVVQVVDIVATLILVNVRASTPPPASTMAELVAVPTAALVLMAVLWRGARPPTSSS